VGALEHRSPVAVEERIYNCYSAVELIAEAVPTSPSHRGRVTTAVDELIVESSRRLAAE